MPERIEGSIARIVETPDGALSMHVEADDGTTYAGALPPTLERVAREGRARAGEAGPSAFHLLGARVAVYADVSDRERSGLYRYRNARSVIVVQWSDHFVGEPGVSSPTAEEL